MFVFSESRVYNLKLPLIFSISKIIYCHRATLGQELIITYFQNGLCILLIKDEIFQVYKVKNKSV